ncbi:MAG: putative type VI secretion system effector [Pseudomonadota bacterium]
MTDFLEHPHPIGLVKLIGRMTAYKSRRKNASFVLTSTDQTTIGIVAVAAALTGLSGQAISTSENAATLDEEADHVEFKIDGLRVEGWLWRSPFNEGDMVEVAAEWHGDHYEAYGIARPIDRTIALYPHCSRGHLAHVLNTGFLWFWLGLFTPSIFMTALSLYIMGPATFTEPYHYITLGGSAAFFGLMFTSLAWKWRPFVKMAEKVFKALDWPNPSRVDLVKSSKAQRGEKDPGEFGTFYFRY